MTPRGPGTVSGTPNDAPQRLLAGRYELAERIGRGGAADVLRAVDLPLRRPVAVKIFRPGGDPALEAGFAEEAALLARLQHPGLVTVYDAGVHDGCPFLVMQLVEGKTLRHRVQEGTLTHPEVRRLGESLASALAHVHAAGVVHRDVKPSNILLDGTERPCLTDFGIARLTDATTCTRSGAFTGTAAYMSPEQVRGDRPGPPSDVYALGLVLLECLTGELEYPGTPLESAVARLHRAPAIPEGTPGAVRELLTAMTATEPEDRPDAGTCARWLAAAGAHTGGRAADGRTTAGHGTAGAVPLPKLPRPRAPRRHLTVRAPLTALGALAGALAVGLTLTALQAPPDDPARRGPTTAVEPGQPTPPEKRDGQTSRPTSPTVEQPDTGERAPEDAQGSDDPAAVRASANSASGGPSTAGAPENSEASASAKDGGPRPGPENPGPPAGKGRGGPPPHAPGAQHGPGR